MDRRAIIVEDELQSPKVPSTHRVGQRRKIRPKGCCQGWGKGRQWVGEPGIRISSMEPWGW